MPDIKSSVGANGGVNKSDDVLTVQTLLNMVPVSEGGANPLLDLDGWYGPAHTGHAITVFQRRQFGTGDGRVDPGRKTITSLNLLANTPGARTVPQPDLEPAEAAFRSIPQALAWANDAVTALRGLAAGTGSAVAGVALLAHFKITAADTRRLAVVRANFDKAILLLGHGKASFKSVSRQKMSADLQGKSAPGYCFPGTKSVNWTPLFHVRTAGQVRPGMEWTGDGCGPKCRAAMVLHEPIHATDSQATYDVYEWGPGYLGMSADRSLHNAASYPSFAAHVSENSPLPLGPRYGAGRLND